MVYIQAYDCHVEVICKGKPLSEHIDETVGDDALGLMRYVESEADEQFEVAVTIGNRFLPMADCVTVHCYADGLYLQGYVHDIPAHRSFRAGQRDQTQRLIFRRMQISTTSAAPLKFAKLDIDADKPADKGAKHMTKDLGTIKVIVQHARSMGSYYGEMSVHSAQSSALSEKALKGQAISQRVSTGRPEAHSAYMKLRSTEAVGKPSVVKFLYRSRADLIAMCIIEPSAQPLQDEAGQVIDSLSKAEARIRDLEARLDSVQANVKRERADSTTDTAPRKKPTVMYEIPDDDDEPVKEIPLPANLQRSTIKPERVL